MKNYFNQIFVEFHEWSPGLVSFFVRLKSNDWEPMNGILILQEDIISGPVAQAEIALNCHQTSPATPPQLHPSPCSGGGVWWCRRGCMSHWSLLVESVTSLAGVSALTVFSAAHSTCISVYVSQSQYAANTLKPTGFFTGSKLSAPGGLCGYWVSRQSEYLLCLIIIRHSDNWALSYQHKSQDTSDSTGFCFYSVHLFYNY